MADNGFSRTLRAMRYIRRVPSSVLAKEVGVSKGLVGQWETKRVNVSEPMQARLIELFHFSPLAMLRLEQLFAELDRADAAREKGIIP